MSQRIKAIIGSISAVGMVVCISGCGHKAEDASVGVPSPSAPPMDARTQQEIASHRAGAQFDAQRRAAGTAQLKAAGGK